MKEETPKWMHRGCIKNVLKNRLEISGGDRRARREAGRAVDASGAVRRAFSKRRKKKKKKKVRAAGRAVDAAGAVRKIEGEKSDFGHAFGVAKNAEQYSFNFASGRLAARRAHLPKKIKNKKSLLYFFFFFYFFGRYQVKGSRFGEDTLKKKNFLSLFFILIFRYQVRGSRFGEHTLKKKQKKL